jgi:endonuclease/exonuclease/phosphatase family metal-dependent hydrolase
MTRNLYLGADLGPILNAFKDTSNPFAVPLAATATWNAVKATNPEERMAAIAEEIAAERPAVVGLQEVTRWTTYASYNPATGTGSGATVAYDFLDLLLDALADEGVVYEEVQGATASNFASPAIPVIPPLTGGVAAVDLLDRDVILRREGVSTWNAHNGTFNALGSFTAPTPAGPVTLPVKRGWGSVDVRTKLATFRFVNSHLEAFGGDLAEQLRYLQAGELLAAQEDIATESGDLPVVYVGDYNSRATTGLAYNRLLTGVGGEAWSDANPGEPGLTCCFDAEVTDEAAELYSRIDLILVDDRVTVHEAEVIGEEPTSDMTESGLWPSDHAGVVATLEMDDSTE